jgi:hypothetical protein
VCNPASSTRGFFFSQNGFEIINSEERMSEVSALLMADSLWDFSADVFKEAVEGWWASKNRPIAMLWVLDKGGNLIIAPEVQEAIFKHGDLVPGQTPISDPARITTPREASCCCASVGSCEYLQIDDDTCCVYLPGTCPSGWKESRNSCNEAAVPEQRSAGNYRGLARGAGEIRFEDSQAPMVQDKSSFALQRVGPHQLINNHSEFNQSKLEEIQTLPGFVKGDRDGTCAMSRLREYWQAPLTSSEGEVGLGLSDDVRFAAVGWPDGKETMTLVED